ncbi:Gfo/Idh/MocA family protein [Parapedobacter koreensis]|uniref:Predicted dehydrogenase n=1 Tax=Parapedobacter koreensis TaxID=332977 RepID=A0A1H7S6M6_9SPHI|nr:Gfo/Idh/MocA family oxidoreductase [Parapedobacter koreensis]SEL67384.1 Predicted dehydrogenase [Parapedobacter koreensis]
MKEQTNNTRREFLKKASFGVAALSAGSIFNGISATSYRRIVGANERIQVAMMGVNSRGFALANNFSSQPNSEVTYICDVDRRAAEKCLRDVVKNQSRQPKLQPDFRKALDDKDVDVLVVAAPDHWHAPAAILASKAGKHVYLEKPCSHNPAEGELLMAASKKYGNVIQMGNQRRSWPNVKQAIEALHGGIIGQPYYAKTWYTNNRASIGVGKPAPVPDWLDFDLWQGPAPRREFQDNLIHYNWHWFWHWGTGEALNNGTHMVDLARWGLQVAYPERVTSTGGRYRYQDDWEAPDTQLITLDFGQRGMIAWEGRSCNGRVNEGESTGVVFYGEKGSVQIGGGNAYQVYDLENKLVKDVKNEVTIDPRNRTNPSQSLDAIHIQDFFKGIKNGQKLASDIESGHISTLLVQLGNIAQRSGGLLDIDPSNGYILDNLEAQALWSREYEKGWEPKI